MTDLHDLNTKYAQVKAEPMGIMEKGMKRFWVCFVEGTDGGHRYRHYSLIKAQREAERLARLPANWGKGVYLFECIGKCHAGQIKWEVPVYGFFNGIGKS